MNKKLKIILIFLLVLAVTFGVVMLLRNTDIAVLNPKGGIASKERDLIIVASLLSLIIVVPVFIMLFTIAWKYRSSNTKATYAPDWDHSRLFESIWWGVPCVIIVILGVITWKATHDLDPYKALESDVKPVKVQVIALQWKWLFLYPEQHIASVNFMQMPVNTPINFEITADAPMNSFWIPSLGGQVYAMSGMTTKLHLMADTADDYKGSSANISGEGFAGMRFTARASSKTDFDTWVRSASQSSNRLGLDEYGALVQPSKDVPASSYVLEQDDLYDKIVRKYMTPASGTQSTKDNPKEDSIPSTSDRGVY